MEATGNSVDIPADQHMLAEWKETTAPIDLPTLVHRLRWHGTTDHAQQPAFTMILDQDWNESRLSYGQLDRRARAIGERIDDLGGRGERVLVVLDPGLDYVASLFGCMYAGAIAVPVYPPSMLRLQHTLSRLQSIVKDADAALMLTSADIKGEHLSPLWGMEDSSAIVVEEVPAESDWQGYKPSPSDIAILQYTSGSTGVPRGVALAHSNLMHNLSALVDRLHFPGAKALHWIPPYHDMGLVGGILLPSYQGVEAVFMQPKDFISNPVHWLRAFDRYRATSTGCPNFGYELCVRKIKPQDCEGLDLSCWKVAVTGAEPVRASTLRRFTDKFAPYGFEPTAFCPALGMAETTVIITGSPLGALPITYEVDSDELARGKIRHASPSESRTQTLVSSGVPIMDMEVEIVDPQSCRRSPPGEVGEIWTRGPSVAAGYWNQPEKTKATFGATLKDTGQGSYLRTGDLGCLVDDELIVTGRQKELIIIGGRNFYPHDIEATVQATTEAFKADAGVAFSIDQDDQEQLVVVQEVWRPGKFDLDQLCHGALDAISSTCDVVPHSLVLVKSGSLPKTSSGKLRRTDCRELFHCHELSEIYRWHSGSTSDHDPRPEYEAPKNEVQQRLARIWMDLLHVDRVGRRDDFFLLGGQSLLVGQLVTMIGEQFRVQVQLSTLFSNPTLEKLSAVIESAGSFESRIEPIDASVSVHPLSAAQQRFWLLNELEQIDAFLHVPVSIRLSGPVDVQQLQAALQGICTKHDSLRTVFEEHDGIPQQQVLDSVNFELQCYRATEQPVSAIKTQLLNTPFCMQQAPLMRAVLIEVAPDRHQLELVFHHIICDASSVEIILRDLSGELRGDSDLCHVDYVHWDQSNDRMDSREKSISYWTDRLQGAPTRLTLPSSLSGESYVSRSRLTSAMTKNIEKLATERGATASMLYLAAYQYVLSRYTGSSDLPVTIPTTNRPSTALSSSVGCYMNPVVFRGRIDSKQGFGDLLESTRTALLADLDHADVPFQDVVGAVGFQRDLSSMPIAQNMFLYQPMMTAVDRIAGATVTAIEPDYSLVTAYDLSMIIHPGDSTNISVVTSPRVSQEVAQRFLDLYIETLTVIVDDPNVSIANLPSRSSHDEAQVDSWNATETQIDSDVNVLQRLAAHAIEFPDRIAITDDQTSLSYQQLERRSSALAVRLRSKFGDRELLVGVHMSRSVDMLVAMLGIWKAGGGYVPLDPTLPKQRIQMMLDDADLFAVITHDDDSMFEGIPFIGIASGDPSSGTADIELIDLADRIAYVIYTSGSTGVPKGVVIEHSCVTNLLNSFQSRPGFDHESRILALTTMSFDISVLELFLPLWCGGEIRLTANQVSNDPDSIVSILQSESITHLQTTPSTLRVLLAAGWKPRESLTIMSGGEPLMPELAEEILGHVSDFWNVYGPTETTVWSTASHVTCPALTIGQPIDNTCIHILDAGRKPVPIGVAGEMYIGGRGLARGYWNREELTSERFVQLQPVESSDRVYQTGDQAYWDWDGQLQFLARNDRQIKLRGFRIELDEIESVIESHQGVGRAAVVTHGDHTSRQIVAFCETNRLDGDSVRAYLQDRLPEYMVPTTVCIVDTIEQTPAGKTDYQALSRHEFVAVAEKSFEAPQSPLEKTIAELWSEVLQRDLISRDDNFFHLGGNSLQAAQLFARLRDRFQVKIPMRALYQRPTVSNIAEAIVCAQLQTQDSHSDLLEELENLSDEDARRLLDGFNDADSID